MVMAATHPSTRPQQGWQELGPRGCLEGSQLLGPNGSLGSVRSAWPPGALSHHCLPDLPWLSVSTHPGLLLQEGHPAQQGPRGLVDHISALRYLPHTVASQLGPEAQQLLLLGTWHRAGPRQTGEAPGLSGRWHGSWGDGWSLDRVRTSAPRKASPVSGPECSARRRGSPGLTNQSQRPSGTRKVTVSSLSVTSRTARPSHTTRARQP